MIVTTRNPSTEHRFDQAMPVSKMLERLGLNPEGHLVICNGTLVTRRDMLRVGDTVEVRSVISGGAL
ncbi:MAG: MoaD/ThiS family protein [Acidimicrobiia bacterium]|jgi:sulfur carrier protein ThiS|nr:MoaD/ThiS family protein [Acidimicrobiia bacterium]MBP8182443.1 MoaD/ThiS family protein [Acidimicrobiia bacterium]